YVAERVLEKLGHLGRLWARDGHDTFDELAIEGGREPCAVRRDTADHLGCIVNGALPVAGIDALGREGEEEVATRHQASRLEGWADDLLGGSRIGRALENEELAVPERSDYFRGSRPDIRHVRVSRLAERRRDGDRDHVRASEPAEVL